MAEACEGTEVEGEGVRSFKRIGDWCFKACAYERKEILVEGLGGDVATGAVSGGSDD